MPIPDNFDQGIDIAALTDAPNAERLAYDIANAIAAQSVMRFDTAAHRGAVLNPPEPGMMAWLEDTRHLTVYDGQSGTWLVVATGPTSWTTPQLGSGYTHGNASSHGNGHGPVRYRRVNRSGVDYMEWDGGLTRTSGAQTSNILSAVLPSALRPTHRASFAVARNATGLSGVSGSHGAVTTVKVDFNPTGTVALISAAAGAAETTWLSLKGIAYPL